VLPSWQNPNLTLPGAHNNGNVSGLWSCFGNDGRVEDDSYTMRLSGAAVDSAFNFTIECVSGGPDRTWYTETLCLCDCRLSLFCISDPRALFHLRSNAFSNIGGQWFSANGTLNVSSGHASVRFDSGARNAGQVRRF